MATTLPLRTSRGRRAAMSVAGILLVGMLALTACEAPSMGRTGAPRATTAPNPLSLAWMAVLKQIGPNGEVSLATAEQAYALVFGSLPGVTAPVNTSGVIPDGTLALRMIMAHYNDLNAAQKQAVLQRFGFTAPASAAGHSAAPGTSATIARMALSNAPTPVPTDEPGTAPYRAMLNTFSATISAALIPVFTLTLPVVLSFDPKLTGNVKGYAACFNSQGGSTGTPVWCRISLEPGLSQETSDNQRFIVAHELFHCFQAAILNDLFAYYYGPKWLIEGSASWIGAAVAGVTASTSFTAGYWDGWLDNPGTTLFSRQYDAIGFYALLQQAGISPWSAIPAMLASQQNGNSPNNTAAYTAATQANPQRVLDLWAASDFREPSLGADWDLKGPGITTTSGEPTTGYSITNGKTLSDSTPAYTALEYLLDAEQADVLEIAFSGTSRLHDGGKFDQAGTANGDYCTKADGNCTCPQGSAYTGPALEQLQGAIDLAITGGTQGASGSVTGLSLDQFCNQKPKSLLTITLAFCQHVFSLAEANQIMQPPTPATTIRVDVNPKGGGSCNYEYKTYLSVVTLIFLPIPGAPGSAAAQLAAQAANISSNPDAKTTVTPVNGVGDAAVFVTGVIAQPPLRLAAFDVIHGSLFLSCGNFNVGSASFSDQQTKLTHACQLVLGRL